MSRDRKLFAALRVAVLPALLLVALVVAWQMGYFELDRRMRLFDTVQRLRLLPWIEMAYLVAYAVVVTLALPAAIATLVAGAVFGAWLGGILSWVASLLATMLSYALARSVVRKPLQRLLGEHRLMRLLRARDDVFRLLRLRLVPVGPFAVLPYAAGVAGASLKRLLIATGIGIVPSVIAYAYVGSALMKSIVSGGDEARRALAIAGAVTLALLAVSVVPALWRRSRG